MKKDISYQERLKKMKESIKENVDILKSNFPDDVTHSGSPDIVRKHDHEIDKDEDGKSDEK